MVVVVGGVQLPAGNSKSAGASYLGLLCSALDNDLAPGVGGGRTVVSHQAARLLAESWPPTTGPIPDQPRHRPPAATIHTTLTSKSRQPRETVKRQNVRRPRSGFGCRSRCPFQKAVVRTDPRTAQTTF